MICYENTLQRFASIFESRELSVQMLVQESNELDKEFQENIANSLSDDVHQRLLELK